MKQVRINVSSVVNASKIRREKRDGRDVIIVPSATLPDDIVMNGSGGPILYPAAEIEKSFAGLERTPAPLGHPSINGRFVSARDPEGLTRGWIGAWNENVRRENGRVLLDKVIDVEVANQSEGGKAVLAAIDKQQPIHTSTGLLAMLDVANGEKHKYTARDIVFDHDAILLDGPGAATPEQGVGIFVNAAGDEIEVINSTLSEDIDRDINWSLDSLMRAVERKERQPLLERMKVAILRIVQGDPTPDQPEGDALNVNGEPMDKAQFDKLVADVAAIGNAVTALAESVPTTVKTEVANAVKPVLDAHEAATKAAKETADAERADLAEKVVNAGLLDEAAAKEATTLVLNGLLKNAPRTAFHVNRGGTGVSQANDRAPLALKGE